MFTDALKRQAATLLKRCERKKFKIATAESCTGGLLSALLTEIPGSSKVFERGFVTYSNAAKKKLLGVPGKTIKAYGAVSAETAAAMAKGALKHSKADIAVSITGIAGPDGGTKAKPVGLVYIATARGKKIKVEKFLFKGNRTSVRLGSITQALKMLDTL